MGLLSGQRVQRDAFPYPDIPPNSMAGSLTTPVTAHNAESSMRKVAVFAAVNLLSGVVSMLPRDGYSGSGPTKQIVGLPQFFTDPDGSGQGMDDWLYQLMYSWLLRGNAVGKILARDPMGRPTQIMLYHPDSCSPWTDDKGRTRWYINGVEQDTRDVWHRRVFPVPGKVLGMSPIALHATTISQGMAAATFGLRFFTDGGHPSAILQQEDSPTVDQATALAVKQRFLAAVRGTREPVVVGKGWKYQAIQIAPNESQFLDTQKYTAAECARIFGPGLPEILGYETGGSMTYANVEQRSVDLLKYSVDRWLIRLENILSADALSRPRYMKFNRGALLATDLLTRFQAHQIALRNKWEVVNEVRELEDMPPVEWGDVPQDPAKPEPTMQDIADGLSVK